MLSIPMKTLSDFIKDQPFFEGVAPDHLVILAAHAERRSIPGHQVIFETGSEATLFYLINRGEVTLQTRFSIGIGNAGLQTLGPGDPVGWSWFFPPRIWQFSAVAKTDVEVIVFDGQKLMQEAEKNHSFGYDLAKRVGFMLSQRLESTRERLLQAYHLLP